VIGNLQPGCEADFVVINPAARRCWRARRPRPNLDELLFAMIVLGMTA
jgi:guanine deaminase